MLHFTGLNAQLFPPQPTCELAYADFDPLFQSSRKEMKRGQLMKRGCTAVCTTEHTYCKMFPIFCCFLKMTGFFSWVPKRVSAHGIGCASSSTYDETPWITLTRYLLEDTPVAPVAQDWMAPLKQTCSNLWLKSSFCQRIHLNLLQDFKVLLSWRSAVLFIYRLLLRMLTHFWLNMCNSGSSWSARCSSVLHSLCFKPFSFTVLAVKNNPKTATANSKGPRDLKKTPNVHCNAS